jgi:putative ATP-dependent endonuclease of OLD family
MYISEIKEILNYRNLSGKIIKFNETMNFLIGENNIGKTNVLELINIFLGVGKFGESDFANVLRPIQIKIKVNYSADEVGFFDDNFDVDNSNSITLIALQDSVDERISYFHDTPNQTKISATVVKKMNVLYYYAQRMPSKEVDFRKTSGSGKVLNYLIQHSLESSGIEERDILKITKLKGIVKNINKKINSLNSITGDNVSAYLDTEADKIMCRMLGLGDENGRELGSLGEGVQYAFNILLQIIEIIYNVKTTRKLEDFEERLINKDGNKLFPLFLVLDEPEVHQHPYRQRSLIKKIEALMKNENLVFIELLKSLFGIDGLIGQIFIATHSPNILLNDYRQFIRLYRPLNATPSNIEIVSGSGMTLDDTLYKHLLRSFLYLKEAMFSKCILFVEGDTENGAMPVFARRMNLDFDELGIGVVKLDGADSVKNCMELYQEFHIKSIAMIDRDKKAKYNHIHDVSFTKGIDFEDDIYDNFTLLDYMKYNNCIGKIGAFVGILRQYGLLLNVPAYQADPNSIVINETLQNTIMADIKVHELNILRDTKNASKSALLAKYVTIVPPAFEKIIKKLAREVK